MDQQYLRSPLRIQERLFKPGLYVGPESDIISDIIAIRTQLNLTLRGSHVHSHQNLKPGDTVPLEVQLNVGCDKYAGEFRNIADRRWHTRPTATSPPTALTSLTIANMLVTNNYQTRLLDVSPPSPSESTSSNGNRRGQIMLWIQSTGIISVLL